jgi:hypothetical protein
LGRSCAASRFGHIRQPDAVASRFLLGLARVARLFTSIGEAGAERSAEDYMLLDGDDTLIEVQGYAK